MGYVSVAYCVDRQTTVQTIEHEDHAEHLHATRIAGNCVPITTCAAQDRATQWCASGVTYICGDVAGQSMTCTQQRIDCVPGKLKKSVSPDKPASLSAPYNCAHTAGVREMKQPQKKPYMIPNAICRTSGGGG